MTEDFQFVAHEGVSVLAYQPWWREGLVHGMTCGPLSFSKEARQSSSNLLALALNVKEVIIPHQFHTNIALDLRRHLHKGYADDVASCDADALIVDRGSNADAAFGVVTADCVPIVVRSGESFALIHAGWRGLAGGIIKEACSYLPNIEQVVIFPCAGSNLYEVGAEVLEEIGPSAMFLPKKGVPQKYLLNMSKTAQTQIEAVCPMATCVCADLCTIESKHFHSYRRDGEKAGRNLTFVAFDRAKKVA